MLFRSLEIPAGTQFSGKNANGSFTFTSNTSVFSYPSGGYFTVNNYVIYEGTTINDSFVVDYGIEGQQFILSNLNIDTDTLSVAVLENNGANTIQYNQATSLFGLNNTSPAFFVQAIADTSYEIVFGDGVFGRKPQDGSTILASYRITNGTDGNGCTNFVINTNLGPINGLTSALSYTLSTANASFNGANSESIESIRFNAPRYYQTQERAVTTNDYKTLILQNFTDVKTVNVYGGENITGSVNYGKIFISPVTYSGFNLSDAEKNEISLYLSDKSVLGITPILIDPDYLYLVINTNVKYDSMVTTLSPNDIQALVTTAIQNYNEANLIDFNITFSLSRFEATINNADASILTNESKVLLRKDVAPIPYQPITITVDFNNQIVPGSIYSTQFNTGTSTYIYTDYNPNINSFTIQQNSDGSVNISNSKAVIYLKDVINNSYISAGTIDYDNGILSLKTITISETATENYIIKFFASPYHADISSKQNNVLEIDIENGVTVTATAA